MEYLSELPPISSIYRKHFSGLSSFTTYFRVCNCINTTGATSESGSTDPSGAPEFTQLFSETRVTRPLALYIFFLLPCLVISIWNTCRYLLLFLKKNGFWNKTTPIMERSGSTSEIHVHCRTVWSVVNCWIRYNNLYCRLCKIVSLSA